MKVQIAPDGLLVWFLSLNRLLPAQLPEWGFLRSESRNWGDVCQGL
jgi:hypothetical protein